MSPDHETIATVASDENLKFWKLFESRAAVGAKGAKNGSPAGGDAHGADARRAGSRALR